MPRRVDLCRSIVNFQTPPLVRSRNNGPDERRFFQRRFSRPSRRMLPPHLHAVPHPVFSPFHPHQSSLPPLPPAVHFILPASGLRSRVSRPAHIITARLRMCAVPPRAASSAGALHFPLLPASPASYPPASPRVPARCFPSSFRRTAACPP